MLAEALSHQSAAEIGMHSLPIAMQSFRCIVG
jgi:hypothetical protein